MGDTVSKNSMRAITTLVVSIFIIIIAGNIFFYQYLKNNDRGEHSVVNVLDFGAKSSHKVDNTKAIQDAINSIEGSGGTVLIPEGEYIISQLKIPSYVELKGSGNSTILKMKKQNNKPLLVLKSDTSQMVHLKNFMIIGNKSNQTSSATDAIHFVNTLNQDKMLKMSRIKEHDSRHLIENIYISETKGNGLYIEGTGESRIKNVQTLRTDGNGIYSNAQDNFFINCSVGDSGLEGILVGRASTNTHFINCKSWYSGRVNSERGDGFLINAVRVSIIGSEAQDNRKHGFVFGGNDIVGSGLLAESNGWLFEKNIRRADGTGFVFLGAQNTNVQGVAADRYTSSKDKSHQSYAVQLLNGARGNIVNISSRGMHIGGIPSQNMDKNKVTIIETQSNGDVDTLGN